MDCGETIKVYDRTCKTPINYLKPTQVRTRSSSVYYSSLIIVIQINITAAKKCYSAAVKASQWH